MSSKLLSRPLSILSPLRFLQLPKPILGRWNSITNPKEQWEIYVDMANYDNCCCSFGYTDKDIECDNEKIYESNI